MTRPPTRSERQQRLKTRALPLIAIALVAFILGVIQGCPGDPNRSAAERYVAAWSKGDYGAMYEELSATSREAIAVEQFKERYAESVAMATMTSLTGGEAGGDETEAEVPVKVRTRAFGTVVSPMNFSFGEDGIAWQDSLLFPGLKPDEELSRKTEMPRRAPILAADGRAMAEGPSLAREHPLGDAMIDVTGLVGTPEEESDLTDLALGFDPGEPTGISGLELAFNERLSGKPGGTLMAVPIKGGDGGKGRDLATGEPAPADPLKTTIDPTLQDSAVSNLAGQLGGVALLDAKKGRIKAMAGQAYSVLQPPGSTMKMVTATAALETGKATLDSEYPFVTEAPADGRMIRNAYNEVCGGNLVESFAHSCNSVFAPLGMEIGEEAMTETAEKYGFNKVPAMFNEAGTAAVDPPIPTIPQPGEYNNELGVSAIGQGKVQATPLLMASIAQTIANGGKLMPTPLTTEPELQPEAQPVRVSSAKTANQLTQMMVAVVTSGTGPAAAIPEAQVAGKTGTAELGSSGSTDGEGQPILDVDAWFAGFAPADKPRLAVAVMLIEADADGGTVAAPIAGAVLSAGL
ncbi:MAG: hypothetical protein JJE10_00325 [Thermoleophilia bacterium]|nr:hypothetical protein [Thermoleophilia bacterium]